MRRHAAARARDWVVASVVRTRGAGCVVEGCAVGGGQESRVRFRGARFFVANGSRPPVPRWVGVGILGKRSVCTNSLAESTTTTANVKTIKTQTQSAGLRRMRLSELRGLCVTRGLDAFGKKEVLVSRLATMDDGDDEARSHGAVSIQSEKDLSSFLKDQTHTWAVPSRKPQTDRGDPTNHERILTPAEHGIDASLIPKYVRALQKKLQRDSRNADSSENAVSSSGTGKQTESNSGCRLFVVGGAVRDLYLGKTPRDFDLLTDATWGQIKRRAKPVVVVGRRFKVAHCFEGNDNGGGGDRGYGNRGNGHVQRSGTFYELVSMARYGGDADAADAADADEEGSDNDADAGGDVLLKNLRKGAGLSQSPRSASAIAHHTRLTLSAFIVPDCRRRDFTMNALAYDVQSGLLYDFCGGLDDIDTRIVRTVHRDGPVTSFSEDPARMLRAVRLAARHDFHFAGNVLSAMKASAHLLRKENSARLAGELKALLTRGYSTKAVKLLWETGVLEHVLHLHATHIARAIDPHTTFVAAPPGAFVFAEGDGVVDLVQTGGHTSHNQDLLRGGKEQGSSDGDRAGSIPLDAPWAESGDQNSLGSHKTGSSLTRHGRGGKVRPRISQIPPPRLPIQGPDTFPAKRQSGFPRRRWKRSCVPTRFSKFFARLIERCYPGLITRQPRLATPITDTDTSPKPSPTPASPSRSRWRNLGGRRWSRAGC